RKFSQNLKTDEFI
ncbi:hypothetical protein BVZ46_01105B, partial [Haemophilus influenzae]